MMRIRSGLSDGRGILVEWRGCGKGVGRSSQEEWVCGFGIGGEVERWGGCYGILVNCFGWELLSKTDTLLDVLFIKSSIRLFPPSTHQTHLHPICTHPPTNPLQPILTNPSPPPLCSPNITHIYPIPPHPISSPTFPSSPIQTPLHQLKRHGRS